MPWTWESRQEKAVNAISAASNYAYLGVIAFFLIITIVGAVIYGILRAMNYEMVLVPAAVILTVFLVTLARNAIKASRAIKTAPRSLRVTITDDGQVIIENDTSHKTYNVHEVSFCIRSKVPYPTTVSVGPTTSYPTGAVLYDVKLIYPGGELWMNDIMRLKFEELNALLGRLRVPINLC